MKKTLLTTVAIAASVMLAGCNEDSPEPPVPLAYDSTPVHASAELAYSGAAPARTIVARGKMAQDTAHLKPAASPDENSEASPERRIAETQSWRFEVSSERLQDVWESHHSLCAYTFVGRCEVTQASVSTKRAHAGGRNANLEMRVDREALGEFLDTLSKSGATPIDKQISREDRSLQWVDLQARKANAERLRDRLQGMVQNHNNGKLSDLLSLERELNRVQSTLDSMESQARVMAQETEKVRMSFRYSSAPETVVDDIWRPIREAWHAMGQTFSRSVGAVLLFVAGIVPWMVILIPGWFILRRGIRSLRRRFLGKD